MELDTNSARIPQAAYIAARGRARALRTGPAAGRESKVVDMITKRKIKKYTYWRSGFLTAFEKCVSPAQRQLITCSKIFSDLRLLLLLLSSYSRHVQGSDIIDNFNMVEKMENIKTHDT